MCIGGQCTARTCSPACGCGQLCVDGTCMAHQCEIDQFACGCTCCDGGDACVAGRCVPQTAIP
jgi:hypothetical protein